MHLILFFLFAGVYSKRMFHALHLFPSLGCEITFSVNTIKFEWRQKQGVIVFSPSLLTIQQNTTIEILNYSPPPHLLQNTGFTECTNGEQSHYQTGAIRSQSAMWFIFISALNKNNSNHPIGCSLSTSAWPLRSEAVILSSRRDAT